MSDFGDATVNAKVDNNTVDTNNIGKNIGSNGIGVGTGVVGTDTAATPLMTVEVLNNTVTDYDGHGIRLVALDTNGTLNATVTGNSVGRAAGGGFPSRIRVDSGNENNPGNNTINLDIKNNIGIGASDAADAPGIGIRLGDGGAATNVLRIEGLSPSPATDVQTENFIAANNPGMFAGTLAGTYNPAKIAEVIHGNTFTATAGNVPQPLLAGLGGVEVGGSERRRDPPHAERAQCGRQFRHRALGGRGRHGDPDRPAAASHAGRGRSVRLANRSIDGRTHHVR